MGTDLQGRLLPQLYSTAECPNQWIGVLDTLCAEMSIRNAAVQILERAGDRLRPVWTARDSRSLAQAELHDRYVNNDENPRFNLRFTGWRPKNIVRDGDRFEARNPEFARLRERLARIGLGRAICATFELPAERYFSLILHRCVNDDRDFDGDEESFLDALLPHLRQTMRLSGAISEARSGTRALEQAFDMMRAGFLLCDTSGNVRWLNRSAEAMIEGSPWLTLKGGRLCPTRPADGAALRQVLRAVPGAAEGHPLAVLGDRDEDGVQLLCAPIHAASPDGPAEAKRELRAIFLSRPGSAPPILPDDLVRLFCLSPAEARLASALAAGASLSSYANLRGISVGTARIQLKQVLAKMQAAKQAELVRQLCGSVVAQTLNHLH